MHIFRVKSIHQRFFIDLGIVITLILLIFSVVSIFYSAQSTKKDIQGKIDLISKLSIQSLSTALWQYNYEYVNNYIDSLFLNEDVIFAHVTAKNKIIKTKTHDGYQSFDFTKAVNPSNFIIKESNVIHKNITVGKVTIVMSKERIRKQIIKSSLITVLLLLLIIAAIFITTYQLFRRHIFNPLIELGNSAKLIANGNLDARIDNKGTDEIGQLARTLSMMMKNIKSITASKDELNNEIYERKKVEKKLLSAFQLNENIIAFSPLGILIYNAAGSCLTVNDTAAKLIGEVRTQILQQNYHKIDSWKNNGLYDVILASMQEKTKRRHEIKVKNTIGKDCILDMQLVPFNLENEPHLLLMFDDITGRKKTEEKIARFGRIFEGSLSEIYLFESDTLKIIQANPAALYSLGYTMEELEKLTALDLKPEITAESFAEFTAPLIKGKKEKIVFETVHKRKDQTLYDVEVHLQLLKHENELIFVTFILDITNRKKLMSQLQQVQKMESIGTLAGGIAHDFNNLLYPIIGFAEMLKDDLPQDSPEYESAQEIFNAGRRGGELVKQILAFSRQTDHKMRPVRFQKILTEVLKLTRSTIPSDIKIHEDIQEDCGLVMAEATQLHQIAMNLITNAYHAVEKASGEISVQLKEIMLDNDDLNDSALQSGQYVMLSVSDNGIGIPMEIVNNIFEPYFTTKAKGKGTGLGLAVVYGILTEHKGDIKVYSETGKGTTFNVYLPLMKKPDETISTERVLDKQTGTERILLVDDEESVVRLEKQMLERLGYKVSARSDSLEALETFNSNPNGYDLVISDMTMPNMTGDQLARKLMSIRPNIPIIICTGFSERINKEQAEANKVKGFLMKPVVKSEMAQMIRKVLDQSKQKKDESLS